ncbi:MAG: spermidine synthase [Propionibacteriaceae bacterium]|nr:spermidine synthase [Propionibacteriaceae bacterium]
MFEELDAQGTRLGLLTLRRRFDPALRSEIYEVKLGDEFLMSSAFTVAERELARLGLASTRGEDLDVLVGGLGLGYTAVEALRDERIRTLTVVDALREVIGWHERGLLPETALTSDARTTLVEADFFALMRGTATLGADAPAVFDAILLDIDHTPRHLLHPSHADLYTVGGLRALQDHLRADGVFALWSDDPPDEDFTAVLAATFTTWVATVITFPNALTRGESTATIYVASGVAGVSPAHS